MARASLKMPLNWFEACITAAKVSLVADQQQAARLFVNMDRTRQQIAQYEKMLCKARKRGETTAPIPR